MYQERLLLALGLVLTACPQSSDDDDSADPGDVGSYLALTGEVTWTDTRESCNWHETYEARSDASIPWLDCPDCAWTVYGTTTTDANDCGAPEGVKSLVLGLRGDEFVQTISGVPGFWLGTFGIDPVWETPWSPETGTLRGTWTTDSDPPTTFGFQGTLTIRELPGDPRFAAPLPPETYDCGWPRRDVPPYAGPYQPTIGADLPDGQLQDLCGEPVWVHDLIGDGYTVLEAGAIDCPPCEAAAASAEELFVGLADAGIVVTYPVVLLEDWGTGAAMTRPAASAWGQENGRAPVLLDPWAWMDTMQGLAPDAGGYPTFFVVAPDGTLLATQEGFDGWSGIVGLIQEHAAR